MALVMKSLFKNGIITKDKMVVRNSLFKKTLSGKDKNSWYPILRPASFEEKLPGTISQNSKFIQLLSLMIYPELSKNPNYLKSKEWKLYLLLKSLCEYLLSPEKSDHQIDLQTKTLNDYLGAKYLVFVFFRSVKLREFSFLSLYPF